MTFAAIGALRVKGIPFYFPFPLYVCTGDHRDLYANQTSICLDPLQNKDEVGTVKHV